MGEIDLELNRFGDMGFGDGVGGFEVGEGPGRAGLCRKRRRRRGR